MFQRIMVPLDGSRRAELAIPVAARLARASRGSLVLVRVVLPPIEMGKYAAGHTTAWERKRYEDERSEAASYLVSAMLTHASDLVGIDTEMGVAGGLVAPTICSLAQREHADLIVICSRGETGFKRWFFGSMAQEVAQQSPVPVLVLNEHGAPFPARRPLHTVQALVVLDDSAQSETVLEPAAQLVAALAAPHEGKLHPVHLADWPSTGGKWEEGCLLIALALHRRRGLPRLLKGSVTERVLRSTRLPLLIVPSKEKAARVHVQEKAQRTPGAGGN